MSDNEEYVSALGPIPQDPTAPLTGTQRFVRSVAKGASFGLSTPFLPIEPEGLVEKGGEFLGSIPTFMAASTVLTPAVAAGLRGVGLASTLARPVLAHGITSAVTGGVLGGIEGLTAPEGTVLGHAAESAVMYPATELGLKYGWKGLKALRGLSKGEAAVIEKGAKATTETPSAAAADAATTMTPDTQFTGPIQPLSRVELPEGALPRPGFTELGAPPSRGLYGPTSGGVDVPPYARLTPATVRGTITKEKPYGYEPEVLGPRGPIREPIPFKFTQQMDILDVPGMDPQMPLPGIKIEKFGPRLNSESFGVKNDRIPLESFIEPLYKPTLPIGNRPTEDMGFRKALEDKLTPTVLKSAEDLSLEDFVTMAGDNAAVGRAVEASGATPEQVWRAAQITRDIPTSPSFQPLGKTPAFYEKWDPELQKKVLVPRDEGVAQMLTTLDNLEAPRQVDLQFDPEQLGFFRTGEGQGVLRRLDVVKQREPLLTSNVVKQSEEEVNRLMEMYDPIPVIEPVVISKAKVAQEATLTREKIGLTDMEQQAMVQAIAQKYAGRPIKEFQDALRRATEGRCK